MFPDVCGSEMWSYILNGLCLATVTGVTVLCSVGKRIQKAVRNTLMCFFCVLGEAGERDLLFLEWSSSVIMVCCAQSTIQTNELPRVIELGPLFYLTE